MTERPLAPATHSIFTPTAMDPQALEAITVGRRELIDRIVDRIERTVTGGTRAHTLVIGPRGSGKTHLFAVALHRALGRPAVRDHLAVAWLPEDVLSIGSYADLLTEILRHVRVPGSDAHPVVVGERHAADLEATLTDLLDGAPLLVVIENLDRVFAGLGTSGAGALRAFVETTADTLMLASAPLQFRAVSSRNEPWYGGFDVERLTDLTVDDGTELLRRRATGRGDDDLARYVITPDGQSRLKAIAHLAGGAPRLWHVLADTITVPTLAAFLPAVTKLMDDLAPHYQQRLWELPTNERKLVAEIARESGARSVGDLAERTGISERVAATALGRLVEAAWVRGQKVDGTDQRRTWYDLREPLLRHHLQFRENRSETLGVIAEFLRTWYSAGRDGTPLTTEETRDLVNTATDRRTRAVILLSYILGPLPDGSHLDALGYVGGTPDRHTALVASALDGDADALTKLLPELRDIVRSRRPSAAAGPPPSGR